MDQEETGLSALLGDLPETLAEAGMDAWRQVYRTALREVGSATSPTREPGYRLRHGHRVAKLGWRLLHHPEIAGRSRRDDAGLVVWLGGLLHDVRKDGFGADPPGSDHAEEARAFVLDRLSAWFEPEIVSRVADAVYLHNKRERPAFLEARIIQDADLIDHFGALEIWLASYAAAAGAKTLDFLLGYLRGDHNRRWREYALGHTWFSVSRNVLRDRIRAADRWLDRLEAEASGNLTWYDES